MRDSLNAPRRAGFTLVETAVALVVAGVVIAGALSLYQTAEDQRKHTVTEERMDAIVKALSEYAAAAGRLPCPADPAVDNNLFGWEWGVNAASIDGGRPIPDADPADPNDNRTCVTWAVPPATGAAPPRNLGILPFLALGLPEETARDAWGRYFTYAVSPVFAQNNDDTDLQADPLVQGQGQDRGNVHIRCLDSAWVTNKDTPPFIDQTAGPKAKFCCAKDGNSMTYPPAADIIIRYAPDGALIWPNDTNAGIDADNEIYNNIRSRENYFQVNPAFDNDPPNITDANDGPYVTLAVVDDPAKARQSLPDSAIPRNYNIAAPAFVLISHGRNGNGAFLANGTRNKFADGSTPGSSEIENGAGGTAVAAAWNNVFHVGPLNRISGARRFDDMVVWRTQDGIMAETGVSSCVYP